MFDIGFISSKRIRIGIYFENKINTVTNNLCLDQTGNCYACYFYPPQW